MGQPALNRDRHRGGERLLFHDATIAIGVLNEARHRIAARAFGLPRDASFLATVIAIGVLAKTLHRLAARALRVRARYPSSADAIIAIAVLRETLHGVAGVRARDTSFGGTMIGIAVLTRALHRIAARALRALAILIRREV